jgi:nicotinamide riboside kinase
VYILKQTVVLQGLIPKSAGYQTLWNKVLRGIKPQGTTFKYKYFREFKTEFKNILGFEFRDYMGSICGKNQRSKISCYCPFKFLQQIKIANTAKALF